MLDPAWRAAGATPPASRAYDAGDAWWAALSLPSLNPDKTFGPLSRPLLGEDVRGTFSGIAGLASWQAMMMRLDLADRENLERMCGTAAELRAMAHALCVVLERQCEELEAGGL